jgi:hypothetical protein
MLALIVSDRILGPPPVLLTFVLGLAKAVRGTLPDFGFVEYPSWAIECGWVAAVLETCQPQG